MAERVKRRYDSSRRQAAAAARRAAILDAASDLFVEGGYAATAVQAIADRAGVALDTVYAAVGPKPALFRAAYERAVSGADDAQSVDEWAFVRRITAEPEAVRKLEIYAESVRVIRPRLVPLFLAGREAAAADPEMAAWWADLLRNRVRNLRRFAEQLVETGRVRAELSVDEVRDVIWATSSPESWLLFVRDRGWSGARYARWLADTWIKTLLA